MRELGEPVERADQADQAEPDEPGAGALALLDDPGA